MEAALHSTSRLTANFQNENKLKFCLGPAMRKTLHGGPSSGSSNSIDVDAWSENKMMTHPERSPVNENSLTITGKEHLSREPLEV